VITLIREHYGETERYYILRADPCYFGMRHQQKCDQDSALSPELKEAIGDVLQSNLEQNRNVFIVRMGRGLKIVRDVKSLNVARDGVEPPTRGFSVLIWYRDYVSLLVVN